MGVIQNKWSIAIHGGAGTIDRKSMSAVKEAEYTATLEEAILKGEEILSPGGNAIDAVVAAISVLEDSHLFNAGRGSVFNFKGEHEMDASLMDGQNRNAGAVACVSSIKNPIVLSKRVMENSEHVLLSGKSAEEFAKEHDLNFENSDYFFDQFRYDQWQSVRGTDHTMLDHTDEKKFGTVGAVALDVNGNLASGTSTGGMTNKKYGRIGDTPLIGAGTWADNNTCAISCTGHGEYFIRWMAAYDVACLMEYKGLSIKDACSKVV